MALNQHHTVLPWAHRYRNEQDRHTTALTNLAATGVEVNMGTCGLEMMGA